MDDVVGEKYELGVVRGLRPAGEPGAVDEVLLLGACGTLVWVPETACTHLRREIDGYVRHVWWRQARRRRLKTCSCFGCMAPGCGRYRLRELLTIQRGSQVQTFDNWTWYTYGALIV